jgi:hypothetical protein
MRRRVKATATQAIAAKRAQNSSYVMRRYAI